MPDECFIPYCENPVVRQGQRTWLSDNSAVVPAAYCDEHKYGCGAGVGVPMQKRPSAFRQLAKRSENDV